MDSGQKQGPTTHHISLDADTSRLFLALVRRRFNIADEDDLPRGVVSWYLKELVQEKGAGQGLVIVAPERELAAAS